jgi:hypothetical protein
MIDLGGGSQPPQRHALQPGASDLVQWHLATGGISKPDHRFGWLSEVTVASLMAHGGHCIGRIVSFYSGTAGWHAAARAGWQARCHGGERALRVGCAWASAARPTRSTRDTNTIWNRVFCITKRLSCLDRHRGHSVICVWYLSLKVRWRKASSEASPSRRPQRGHRDEEQRCLSMRSFSPSA